MGGDNRFDFSVDGSDTSLNVRIDILLLQFVPGGP